MNEESKNITVGFATLIVLLLAGAFSFGGGQINASTGVTIKGTFNQIDGLKQGDDVRMGGIKIGEISSMILGEQYTAIVTMQITTAVKIPIDTSAAIHTDGLFGSKFIELEPGGDEEYLKDGDSVDLTQDSMVIQDLMELIIGEAKARTKKK